MFLRRLDDARAVVDAVDDGADNTQSDIFRHNTPNSAAERLQMLKTINQLNFINRTFVSL